MSLIFAILNIYYLCLNTHFYWGANSYTFFFYKCIPHYFIIYKASAFFPKKKKVNVNKNVFLTFIYTYLFQKLDYLYFVSVLHLIFCKFYFCARSQPNLVEGSILLRHILGKISFVSIKCKSKQSIYQQVTQN